MNSIQAVMCVIAVCAVAACGAIGYEYLADDADEPAVHKQGNIIMAYSGTCGDNLTWTLDDSGKLTISGTGAMTNYANSNRAPWYAYRAYIVTINIESGVTSIGDYAFYACNNATGSLAIPNSVTYIGKYAFSNCSGFTGSLTIPSSVTFIGSSAFYYCNGFTGSLTIPDSVTSIGDDAFYYCTGFTGSLTISNSLTGISIGVFRGCSGFTGSLTIPNSVTIIDRLAFGNCSGFTSLTISNSVRLIDRNAFVDCSGFTSPLTIPDSVRSIGADAFRGCSNFKTVYNQSPYLTLQKGSEENGYAAYYAETLVQGNATLTLNKADTDSTDDQWIPKTVIVKPGETKELDQYPSFTTQVPGTNKITTITYTATGWTEQNEL